RGRASEAGGAARPVALRDDVHVGCRREARAGEGGTQLSDVRRAVSRHAAIRARGLRARLAAVSRREDAVLTGAARPRARRTLASMPATSVTRRRFIGHAVTLCAGSLAARVS